MVHLLRNLKTAPAKESPAMAHINRDEEIKERVAHLSPRMQVNIISKQKLEPRSMLFFCFSAHLTINLSQVSNLEFRIVMSKLQCLKPHPLSLHPRYKKLMSSQSIEG